MPKIPSSRLANAPYLLTGLLLLACCSLVPYARVFAATPDADQEEHGPGYVQRTRKAALVEGFPALSLPPQSKLIHSSVKTMGDLQGMQTLYHSALDVPTNVKFFHLKLPKEGWQDLTPQKKPYSRHEEFLEFKKGDTKINISVEHEDDETEIVLEIPVKASSK